MRGLAVVLLLALSPILHAVPSVRFSADHTEVTTATQLGLELENDGDVPLIDPQVVIELNPGLVFSGAISEFGGWTCTMDGERKATCRQTAIAPGTHHSFFFQVNATRAGRFNIHATFTAQNLPTAARATIHVNSTNRIVVTTAADFGAGSLRAAIESINADPLCGATVRCIINFAQPMTITPSIPLPPIRKCNVEISGGIGIEPPNEPKPVVISGEKAGWGNGLEVRASCPQEIGGVHLNSLVIHSWPWNGIYYEAPEKHTGRHSVNLSYIGTNAMGLEARPNGGRGIVTDSPYERLAVISTVISGNARSGVALFRGEDVGLGGVKIGINRHHQPLGNGASGVFTLGVPVTIGGSIIAYNAHAGVSIARGTPRASAEFTEIHSNGGLPIDWALDGRTLPDDEGDLIPNTPRIADAFYNAGTNVTIIRGTVRLRRGAFPSDRYVVRSHVASSARGDVVEMLGSGFQLVDPPPGNEAGDVVFEITLAGDYRGRLIAVQLQVDMPGSAADLVSEISEAEAVR